ncbi:MAG: D-glycero-beta-D-manno-heptose 1-phosphate adenylyltransferase [Candidatus Omnitrophica bacterium]|nr:D-glycero-beta-D-manno-heptose 1-phosphate adenylyltransferase [Candidatus Omnitrophota bacterium]
MTTAKIKSHKQLTAIVSSLKRKKKKVAFTNGCFDILHAGHVKYLEDAAKKADILIVALNTDSSIRRIKGPIRPLTKLKDRQYVVAALGCVDYVTSFSEPTPLALIKNLKPDFIIKGADWKVSDIVGRDFVSTYGGIAATVLYKKGYSTTAIIKKIAGSFGK